VKAQVEQLEGLVSAWWENEPTYVRPSDDRLEEQIYFTLRGVIAASAASQPMRRVFYPGAVRCDDAEKRAVLIRELDTFLQTVTAHRVGGRHRAGSWHFRFHIYTTLRFDEFTKKLVEKLCGYLKDKQSLPLAKIMSSDQAAYLQIGPVVLVRTGFDFHATVLNEQGVTEFASRSRLDLDPSLILGELKEHTTAHFSFVRPNRREHDPCGQPDPAEKSPPKTVHIDTVHVGTAHVGTVDD
jgi:hypothetical protein